METILELRKELADLIIQYDSKLRENLRIESYYNAELGDLISELSVLEGQIIICTEALKMDEKDLELDEIVENVNKIKNAIKDNLDIYDRKRTDFNAVIENLNKYSDDELKELEEVYKGFVRKHHPALILYIPEPHDKACRYLRSTYLLNDWNGFKSFPYPETLLSVEDIVYTENQTEETYINKYKEFIDGYKNELAKLAKFDDKMASLKKVIEDDMLIARNETDIRSRIYQAKDKVVEVISRCEEIFPSEVQFKL